MQIGKRPSPSRHRLLQIVLSLGMLVFAACGQQDTSAQTPERKAPPQPKSQVIDAPTGENAPKNPPSTFTVPTPEVRPNPVVRGNITQSPVIDLSFSVGGRIIDLPLSEGRFVSRDLPAGRLDPAPFREAIENALTLRTRALSEYTSAEGELRRQRLRHEAGAIPLQDVETPRAAYEDAAANLRLTESLLENARRDEARTSIRGGVEGTVEAVLVEPNSRIRADQPIYALRTAMPLLAEFIVENVDLEWIESIQVRFAESGDWYPGTLQSHTLNANGSIQLNIKITAPDSLATHLRKDMSIYARLILPPTADNIRIPFSAVFQQPGEAPHVRISPAHSHTRRRITIYGANENGVEIVSGLSGGEELIIAE